ncbi:MAG: XRE family transcriptional regulator, partial [Sphingobacteriaceae bacterium]|nr:XRE family transcriptional regulator [Cytophagaceae bacterium]
MKAQLIEENGAPRFTVLPYSERFSKELEAFDSLEDFL